MIDFRPSDAQHLLIVTARDYLRRECPVEVAQQFAREGGGTGDTRAESGDGPAPSASIAEKLWRGMAELGWPGLLVPADLGGSEGSLLDVMLLVEEMGYAALPGPYVSSAVVATTLLLASVDKEQRTRVLGPMAMGDHLATLALIDEHGRVDLDDVLLACERARLTGRKLFVRDAHVANHLLVVVRKGPDLSVLALPIDRRGITLTPLDTIGGDKLSTVTFDEVPVRAEDWLAVGRAGIEAALQAGALARSAEMVGAARRILELAVEHAKTRVQGGRPIGAYQAIQHACADLVRDVDCARGLLHVAAWKASVGRAEPALEERDFDAGGADGRTVAPAIADIAMAKAYAGEACVAVARRGHQIFGAISYCEEHPMHLLHKRIYAASLDCGDAAFHLETVARAIGLAS